jgi:1-acyl-sn-glycerol-3-phosphate acyltransferase
MGEGDRPADTGSRVVPLRSRTGARRVVPLLSPGEVARRLAALERQVEEALGAERGGSGTRYVERAIEGVLDAYASGRAWLSSETAWLTSSLVGELSLAAFRRWWWRVDVVGAERIPPGPVLLVANRGSTLLPYDALMAAVTLGGSGRPPRRVHPFVDEWLTALPVVGPALEGLGAERVAPPRVRRVLEGGEAALVFPEGRDAVARPYTHAYRVEKFARPALLRVAVATGVPIVPVGIIGVDEVHPVLARIPLPRILSALDVPALALTPTLVPLPTKWRLFIGDPLDTAARHRPADAGDGGAMRALAAQVRERLQGLVSDGLRRRRSIFL